jgi:hypothetical protein
VCNLATAGEMVTRGDVSSIHIPSVQYWMFLLVIIMRDGIAVDVGCCSPSPPDLVGIVAICVEWRGMLLELVVLMSTEFIIFVKSLQSWLSHVFQCRGCSVAVRTSELKRWVSLCTVHVLKSCIIVCVLSSLLTIEFV